jgi:Zn-dependent protease
MLSLPIHFGVPLPIAIHNPAYQGFGSANGGLLDYMIYVNLLLAAFNLIPIPPLDGYAVLNGLVSNYWNILLEPIRRYSIPLLLALVFLPSFIQLPGFDFSPLGRIIGGPFLFLQTVIQGIS